MPNYALWDGDALVWRFGWIDSSGICIRNLVRFIEECHIKIGATKSEFFLGSSDRSNFRYKVNPEYKAQRKGKKRPPNEDTVREYLLAEYDTKVIIGAEADDALGISQCRYGDKSVIFTNDKDLDMIPGWHYDIDFHREVNYKDGKQIRKAYKREQFYKVEDPGFLSLRRNNKRTVLCGAGHLWFCAQLLLGDTADNILGVSKLSGTRFGPVAAYEYLKDAKTFEAGIKLCYNKYIELVEDCAKQSFIDNCKQLWIKRKTGREEIFPLEWIS